MKSTCDNFIVSHKTESKRNKRCNMSAYKLEYYKLKMVGYRL